jgi:hypothetical protein
VGERRRSGAAAPRPACPIFTSNAYIPDLGATFGGLREQIPVGFNAGAHQERASLGSAAKQTSVYQQVELSHGVIGEPHHYHIAAAALRPGETAEQFLQLRYRRKREGGNVSCLASFTRSNLPAKIAMPCREELRQAIVNSLKAGRSRPARAAGKKKTK